MSDSSIFLKALAIGLKTVAEGIEAMSEKMEEFQQEQHPEKTDDTETKEEFASTGSPEPAKEPPKRKKTREEKKVKAGKKGGKKWERKTLSDTDVLFNVIKESGGIINVETLMEKTGYGKKKVYDATYRLRKEGKIRSRGNGRYEIIK